MSVLTKSPSVEQGCGHMNLDLTPKKSWQNWKPPSTAGVSDLIVSVEIGSLRRWMFRAGLGAL